MANESIRAAFERIWQHIVNALSGKADTDHEHDDLYLRLNEKTLVTAGADLNSYTTPNTYVIQTVAEGEQISNTPYDGACGTLIVSSMRSGVGASRTGCYQIFLGYNGKVYYRKSIDNSTWENWECNYTSAGGTMDTGATVLLQNDDGRKIRLSGGSVASIGSTNSTWAQGLSFKDNNETKTITVGAFGAKNDLSYLYIGTVYNDYAFHVDTSNRICLKSTANYGSTLPAAGNAGRIFFKKA